MQTELAKECWSNFLANEAARRTAATAEPATRSERREHSETLKRVAIHEAAHCVVAVAVGVDVLRLTATEAGGTCEFQSIEALRRLDVEQHAAVNVAGLRGEIKAGLVPTWTRLEDHASDDALNLRRTLSDISELGRPTVRGRAVRLADTILAERWPAVERLAGELLNNGTLDRSMIGRALEVN